MIEPWYDLFYIGPLCRGANAYALYLADDLCDSSASELAARRAVVAAANEKQDRIGALLDTWERAGVATVQTTTTVHDETVYVTAAPSTSGTVSVPSVFDTWPVGTCPCCHQPLLKAAPEPEPTMGELPPPSGWRDREPLL